MKPSTKKNLKRVGTFFGTLLFLILAFGFYVYSLIPADTGKPIVLQQELFHKPSQTYPVSAKFIYKSATELAAMIRHREATSVEIVTEFINNIKANNYKYNALIYMREREALAEAQLADDAVAKGDTSQPLLGVPITIKEMFWVTGSPSTNNAKMFGFTAPRDAAVVTQLKRAGAVVLGTTNVPFMLGDYQTQGEVYPTANNPFDTSRTPGGSTGGGAAALAAGFSALELGSDLGGSIRVPAVFCGLWSLKPTFGAVNVTDGTSPDSTYKYSRLALCSPGPLARAPEDLAIAWNIIRDTKIDERFQSPIQWPVASNKGIGQYKFAWMDEWKCGNKVVRVSADTKEKLQTLLSSLNQRGAATTKTAPDSYTAMLDMFLSSFGSMMGEGQPWLLRKFMELDMQKMGRGEHSFEAFNNSIMDASDESWTKIEADRKVLIQQWESFFQQYDFFICPVTYDAAFPKCEKGAAIKADDGTTVGYMDYSPYSAIFNATGHPIITVPMGLNKKGLPIGIQIVGRFYSEPELLRLAGLLKDIAPGFVRPKETALVGIQ